MALVQNWPFQKEVEQERVPAGQHGNGSREVTRSCAPMRPTA